MGVAPVLGASIIAAEYGILRLIGIRIPGAVEAFLLGVFATAAFFLVGGFFAVWSGGFYKLVGGEAESWTGDELRRLGTQWKTFHNVPIEEGEPPHTWEVDVDHVAVGPHGILVVESKLTSRDIDLKSSRLPKQVRQDAAQVSRNARAIRKAVQSAGHLEVPIIPILVYWGRGIEAPEGSVRTLGSVWATRGADAREWIELVRSPRISDSERLAAIQAVQALT